MLNKHGIRIMGGSYTPTERIQIAEKEPEVKAVKPKEYRYPTLKHALEMRYGK